MAKNIMRMLRKFPRNPNLYIWSEPQGGIWSSNVYPWQETTPWTLSAPGI